MAEEFHEEVVEEQPSVPGADVEMVEGDEAEASAPRNGGGELPFAEGDDSEQRVQFISYLTSPVVTLVVGEGESETILTAHQALLTQSPFFSDACAAFTDDGSVSSLNPLSTGSSCYLATATLTLTAFSRDK